MRKMIQYVLWTVLLVLLYAVQTAYGMPNLLPGAVALIACRMGARAGAIFGVLAGVLCGSASNLGVLWAPVYAALGYAVGTGAARYLRRNAVTAVATAAVVTGAAELLHRIPWQVQV